jgi:DNA-binding transcriptional LysR family regulator
MSVNFRTLDLNLLRVFAAVMVERNVTRAAAQLAMTQPAVSNALRRLREAAGDELFVTVPSGVLPTAHAEALWPDIRFALDRLRQALDPQGFDPTQDERGFTLAMADATATVLMPSFMAALAREGARAEVRVLPLTSRDPRAQLEHGSADAAVGFFPDVAAALAAEGPRGTIVLEPLYRCEYVCVMRRGHALARTANLTLEAYCQADHVRVNFAGRPRGFVDEALAAARRERHVALTVNQFSTAARVVHDSDLIAVLPRSFVPASGLGEGLAMHRFPGVLPAIEVSLLWHRRHERDAAQRWWRATFAAAARGLGIGAKAPLVEHAASAVEGNPPPSARAVAQHG